MAFLAAGLMAAIPVVPASATTTVLDFSGNICGPMGGSTCSNGTAIDKFYGSTADVSILWRSLNAPGSATEVSENVFYWTANYADLVDVAYSSSATGEAGFFLAPGKTLTLDSVDVGGWPNTDRTSSVRVYDFDYNLLFDTGSIVFPGTTATTINLGISSNTGLIFQWGPDSFNGGIDNLTFTVRDAGGPPIPEPGTWVMLIAGFGLVGVAARRRAAVSAA
jgi:hypothetical protein